MGSGSSDDSLEQRALIADLINTYGEQVWNYAFILSRDIHLADDITQDVFLKAHAHIDSFRGESSIKTWLFSITRNVATDYRRNSFFRRVTLVQNVFHKGTYQSAENEALDQLFTDQIWKLVLDLPVKLREVLILYVLQQMSFTEISALLDIPEGTVRSRLHRARVKMTGLLKEGGEADE